MTLRLVTSGEPEPDTEDVERIARITERLAEVVKSDGTYWIVSAVGEDITVAYFGGQLESTVLAEAIAADMKREAVGL